MLKWKKIQAGVYEATGLGGEVFRVVKSSRLDEQKGRWMAYANGECFDSASTMAEAKAWCKSETVKVRVEIEWGRVWDASQGWMRPTPGMGCYVTVIETQGNSFRGCPLGRATSVEGAIDDFIQRGRYEYTGKGRLQRQLIEVVDTRDRRVQGA